MKVLLISADPPERNVKFRKTLGIPDSFTLLSDVDHRSARCFIRFLKHYPAGANWHVGTAWERKA